jgi:crotonobetainyl-CoA:carnitine CoA-transferase CaiB-like acyl-CoA transferase
VVAAVAAALAESATGEVAERISKAGGLAVPVHTPDEWARRDQGAAVARLPLLTLRRAGDAASVDPSSSGLSHLPAAGLRVLDLTRVISGPVATRTLGHLGADVLRVDNPRLPELREQHLDTGFGKRSTLLDLDRREDRAQFDDLIDAADVVVTGYRPGALDRHGLDPAALLDRRPSLIIARLSAWSGVGPWAGRRGFDSLVQAASGIAVLEAARGGKGSGSGDGSGSGGDGGWTPGRLPVQALDHATGYLLAAAVLRAQTNRRRQGGGWVAELSLAQTAAWLLRHASDSAAGEDRETGSYDLSPWLAEVDTPDGRIRHALPPITIDGVPRDWRRPVSPWGGDAPVWLPR